MKRRVGMIDTLPKAQRFLTDVYRRMDPSYKIQLQATGYRCERGLHAAGFRQRKPDVTPEEIRRSWNRIRLGPGPWDEWEFEPGEEPVENSDVVLKVASAFHDLGIAHALAGSWASAFHGEPGSNEDADIIAEPFPGQEAALVARFRPESDDYVSIDAVRRAIRERGSFPIINSAAGFKVDVFIRKDGPFDRSVLSRRAPITAVDDPWYPLVMISPEDSILLKLEWYRIGNESSERQWLDILGLLRVKAGALDEAYLDQWAPILKVDDLLAEARRDAVV